MKNRLTDTYKAFDVWRRHGPHLVIRYRCFEDLVTGRFCVQSADFYKPPVPEERIAQLEAQFIELLLEESPFKRSLSFVTLEEALLHHIETFGAINPVEL